MTQLPRKKRRSCCTLWKTSSDTGLYACLTLPVAFRIRHDILARSTKLALVASNDRIAVSLPRILRPSMIMYNLSRQSSLGCCFCFALDALLYYQCTGIERCLLLNLSLCSSPSINFSLFLSASVNVNVSFSLMLSLYPSLSFSIRLFFSIQLSLPRIHLPASLACIFLLVPITTPSFPPPDSNSEPEGDGCSRLH